MPVLRLLSADGQQVLREFRILGPETTIGRERDNAVVLTDESVSRRHARLWITDDGYTIFDENSANGVWVRDARVRSALLAPNECFHVGDCVMQVAEEEALPAPAAAAPAVDPAPPSSAKSSGCWAVALLSIVLGSGCAAGLMMYLLRPYWVPFVRGGGSVFEGSGRPAATPTVEPPPSPCPVADAHLCPWTYKTATTTAASCPPGFCWDGGPLGSATCKQQGLVEHAHRSRWSDVFCDDGFTPVLSRCSDAIERCAPR